MGRVSWRWWSDSQSCRKAVLLALLVVAVVDESLQTNGTMESPLFYISEFESKELDNSVKPFFSPAYNRSVDELCKMYRQNALADAEAGVFPPPFSRFLPTSSEDRVNFGFIKFGKVGGTTVQAILKAFFKRLKKEALESGVQKEALEDTYVSCPCRLNVTNGDQVLTWTNDKASAYLGHQYYEAHRYAPGKMHYLILTRDPMDEFISAFFYKNPRDYTNDTNAGMYELLNSFKELFQPGVSIPSIFSNGFRPESPYSNLVKMACDREVAPDFPGDIKLDCDLGHETMLSDEKWTSRMRDIALNRIFFPPPNIFITAANLVGHFQQTVELMTKRIFQKPFTEEETRTHVTMPTINKQEKHYWRPSLSDVPVAFREQFRAKFTAAFELDEALRCKFRTDAEILGIKFE